MAPDKNRIEIPGAALGLPFISIIGFDSRRDSSLKLFPHSHRGHEITFLFSGHVTWVLQNGDELHLKGGDLAITQPGVVHRGNLDVIEPAELFWMVIDVSRALKGAVRPFSADEAQRLARAFSRAGNRTVPASPYTADTLRRLRDLARSAPAGHRRPAGLNSLLYRSLAVALIAGVARDLSRPTAFKSIGLYVREALAFMERHYREPLCAATVARRLGIGESRFYAMFKEKAGMTPMDCLQRIRVEKAKRLLSDPGRSVTSVAAATGFSSGRYFATCFKKFTGTTPGRFRACARPAQSTAE